MESFYHYVISAKQATDRRKAMEEHFAQWGLQPNFFEAIMGNTLTEGQLKEAVDDHGLLMVGEIGCSLSHLGVYKKLLESKEPYALVMEDDARLNQEFFTLIPAIKKFMNSLNEPAVLILYKIKGHTKEVYKLDNSNAVLHALAGSGAHGYIINRKAAENLLEAQTPVKFEIDAWAIYQKLLYLKLYCTNLTLVHLDQEQAANSVIDKISFRHARSSSQIKLQKDASISKMYNSFSFSRKCQIQAYRLLRHIQELYYDKEE